jgi:mannose-6-phosphate isomerase-like protein (cupin superfamily)
MRAASRPPSFHVRRHVKRHQYAELVAAQAASGRPYLEFIRTAPMSIGFYVLPVGGTDGQQPHREDEVYVVMAGIAQFTAGTETREAASGDVLYVEAGVPHRFHDITEELHLVVVFAPPES